MDQNNIIISKIDFPEIQNIWECYLWPDRKTKIETHSSIVFGTNPFVYDMNYFSQPVIYFGAYVNNRLVGVNSGHVTGESYRSRGLYVFPEARNKGIGNRLLSVTVEEAIKNNAKYVWSIPRKSALKTYLGLNFVTVGDFFKTETAEANIYVLLNLINS